MLRKKQKRYAFPVQKNMADFLTGLLKIKHRQDYKKPKPEEASAFLTVLFGRAVFLYRLYQHFLNFFHAAGEIEVFVGEF